MGPKEPTIYESALQKGYSRRTFLKMCAALAATMGLDYTQTAQVTHAMETKKRVPVIWLQMQDCTGCSESFIRSSYPKVESVIFNMISLEYMEVLSAAAGFQTEDAEQNVLKKYSGEYVLIVEGSVPSQVGYLSIGGRSGLDLLKEAAAHAKAVLAFGTCSSWGGIAKAKPNPTGAQPISAVLGGIPIIRVPGCPPIAEVMTGVIAHIVTFGQLPETDMLGRPKAFYRHRIHDKCNRRAYFDAGLFAESFDDPNLKAGYCLYKLGCKGPTTYNSCAEMRWNGGVSYPIQSGNPCIGCSEQDFWDNGPFYTHQAKLPFTQTTINPEKWGAGIVGATAVGVAAHAGITFTIKHHKEKEQDRGDRNE
ncbi:hydrogenase small subunit [Sporolactobacillus spathodeae]|uniref:Hydrogenase small subunit n=1 Tax=Sporolactobacillus spathodeae TaxID=1465502 RepID=A0ABS2Q5Y3_9BACL|nr:hydrogenase small subunit [Sporolactobacillus spathodeae]MBM7657184.1 hydrogenase small subunit [Sporolactobacillus spathodeae]